jgi:hypothetical protein
MTVAGALRRLETAATKEAPISAASKMSVQLSYAARSLGDGRA